MEPEGMPKLMKEKIPLNALGLDAISQESFAAIHAELKQICFSKEPGFMVKVRDILSKCSEGQIGMFSINDILGLQQETDLGLGFSQFGEVDLSTGTASGINLMSRHFKTRMTYPVPSSFHQTLVMDLPKILAYLQLTADSCVTVAAVSQALALSAVRGSLGAGNCSQMYASGYVIDFNGFQGLMCSGGTPTNTIAYLPTSLLGPDMKTLRIHIKSFPLQIPASAADLAAQGRVIPIGLYAQTTFSDMNSVLKMRTEICRDAKSSTVLKPKRFIFQCLKVATDALFHPVVMPFTNVFVFGEFDPYQAIDINTIKTTSRSQSETALPTMSGDRDEEAPASARGRLKKVRRINRA